VDTFWKHHEVPEFRAQLRRKLRQIAIQQATNVGKGQPEPEKINESDID